MSGVTKLLFQLNSCTDLSKAQFIPVIKMTSQIEMKWNIWSRINQRGKRCIILKTTLVFLQKNTRCHFLENFILKYFLTKFSHGKIIQEQIINEFIKIRSWLLLIIVYTTIKVSNATELSLTLFRMGIFGAAHGWGGGKKAPLPKICHKYRTIMKFGAFVPFLKKIQKYMIHVTHSLSSAGINIFSPEIRKFRYIQKYRYRLHLVTSFLILLMFLESLKAVLTDMVIILMMSAKNGYSRPL